MFRMPGVELELMGIAQYRHPRIISVHCLVCRPRRMSRIKHVVYEDGNPVGWYGPDHVEMQRQRLRGEVLLLVWQNTFKIRPEVLTAEEKKEWIARQSGVTAGSDAFFPFGDNVERARKSGVQYIVQPGGSIRDDHVIATCNKYGIVMAFTGMRLFHH